MQIPSDSGVWERCRLCSDLAPSPHSSSPSAKCHSRFLQLDSNMERMSYPCHSIPLLYAPFHFMVWLIIQVHFFWFYSRFVLSGSARINKPPVTWHYIQYMSLFQTTDYLKKCSGGQYH